MSDIPYLGLNPFSEKDAPFFFGRNVQKIAIARSLRLLPLTILFPNLSTNSAIRR